MVAHEEEDEDEDEGREDLKNLESNGVETHDQESGEGPNCKSSFRLQDLQTGGSIPMIELNDDSTSGWSSPPGDCFQVRGEHYLMSKIKVPGGDLLFEPLALDWIKSENGRIDQILRDPTNRIMCRIEEAVTQGEISKRPFVLAINIQVPGKCHYSLVIYFVYKSPFLEGSLLDRFIKGDREFKNSRLKLIANVVKGPWVVKKAVGDHGICLLGKSLTCIYVQEENFLEVDVDIGSSLLANAIVHLAINYLTSLTVDLAFLIEGQTEDELPERLLGSIRFSHLELSGAIPVKVNDIPNEISPVHNYDNASSTVVTSESRCRSNPSVGTLNGQLPSSSLAYPSVETLNGPQPITSNPLAYPSVETLNGQLASAPLSHPDPLLTSDRAPVDMPPIATGTSRSDSEDYEQRHHNHEEQNSTSINLNNFSVVQSSIRNSFERTLFSFNSEWWSKQQL